VIDKAAKLRLPAAIIQPRALAVRDQAPSRNLILVDGVPPQV
jgi:hypothetical protein